MGTKRHKPEDVVAKLRQADVLIAQGQSVAEVDPNSRRDGGDVLPLAQGVRRPEDGSARRMKDLEVENQRLRKAIADLTLDKLILQEAARGRRLEPRAPSSLCRAYRGDDEGIRAPGLPGARPTSLNTAQGAAGAETTRWH